VIQKSGAWFAYGDERLGQGRENAKQFLKENDEVRGRILDDIYEQLGLVSPPAAQEAPPEEDGAELPGRPVEEPTPQQVF
jgi:recombination protein RecA